MSDVTGRNRKPIWVGGGSIAGLVLGSLIGMWAHAHDAAWLTPVIDATAPIGTMWGNALRLVVTPLVTAQLIYALVTARSATVVGRITGLSFLIFAVMLVTGGLLTAAATRLILSSIHLAPDALAAFRAAVPDAPRPDVAPAGFATWLIGLIPSNALRAATQDNLVGVLIFTLAAGCAAAQLPAERRALVGELSRAIAETMMIVVGWITWVMPIAVFAIALSTAGRSGPGPLELVGVFMVVVCVVMLVWTLLLYPIAAVAGGVSMRRFANAVAPAQLVGMSTRSSIASLPALIDGAQHRLRLRPDVSSVVSALAVSTFKFSYPISSPVQFMFVAYVYGIDLSTMQLIFYVLGIVVLSFASVGIPGGGAMMRAAPLYVAAGVPLEGYLLTEAVETIPDVFKTLLNVTGDMTAASIVNRLSVRDEAQGGEAANIDPVHATAAIGEPDHVRSA